MPLDLTHRPRRLRRTPGIRALVRETHLEPSQLIYPLFVCFGEGVRKPIASMPGVAQMSVDTIVEEVGAAAGDGVTSVLLFGLPAHKDERGTSASDPHGPVQEAVRAIRATHPDTVIVTDVCLCEYTSHGHCGIVTNGVVENDPTVELLVLEALSHAKAGADIVAPSDMMDGRIGAIREALDAAGHAGTAVMSYAAKYASAFYGPFRDAADSTPAFGDRRSHQMDPANAREALRQVALDVDQGADMVMVKPALPYLDILWRVKDTFGLPTVAYHVSGEYSMVKAAGANGWIDEPRAMMESLIAIRRAGADAIITYYARDAARQLTRRS
ncbi:MAG: porphobilinogen synthase [Acidobacteria bacterium]|nr:porphobilinogen synthase [Acidobacteriota bacterium]